MLIFTRIDMEKISIGFRKVVHLLFGAVVLTLLGVVWGCEKGEEKLSNDVRFLKGETISYDSDGGQWLAVYSSVAWNISYSFPEGSESDWCTIGQLSGRGNDRVWIEYTVNAGATRAVDFVVRFDDGQEWTGRLTQLGKNESLPAPDPNVNGWLEVPEYENYGGSEMVLATHYVPGKVDMRNYTVLYDTEHYVPVWVAYPLHKSYTSGSGYRTDAWNFDPIIPENMQTSMFNALGSGYQRGHMLPSASRYVNVEANEQTFYFTNMTPQNGNFNGGLWANMEEWVRSKQGKDRDTLYVVTGAVLSRAESGESIQYTTNYGNDRKRIAIPRYYYKALLKSDYDDRSGSRSYRTIAFWFEHKSANRQVAASDAISIRELEARTGIDFFVHLNRTIQDEVEGSIDMNYWDF